MTAILVNGTDLGATYGLYADRIGGWLGATEVSLGLVNVAGRDGGLAVPATVRRGRRIEIAGTLRKDSASDRRAAERQVGDLVRSGAVRLVVDDGLSGLMQTEARLHSLITVPFGPSLTPLASRFTMAFEAESPYWRDVEPTTRSVAATATRYTVPLGTAPSAPIIRVMGSATTPTLTYRDAGGASVWTLTLATLASDEYLDIDMGTGKVTFVDSGVTSNGLSKITAGDFPWGLDPQDGDYGTAAWPTVEISAGSAEILWWRNWL